MPSTFNAAGGPDGRWSRRAMLAAACATSALALGCTSSPKPSGLENARFQDFMRLSVLLIPHGLDTITGHRLAAAFEADRPPIAGHIAALLQLAASKRATTVEEFFPFAAGAPRATALRIISAWYLGVVEDKAGAQVFANVDALMFKPMSDVMTIPTYPSAGPNDWGRFSPPLAAMPSF